MIPPMRQVAQARDEQVAKIVALVDAMAARGQADALIAPLRSRLQRLRPVRKPRFGRVLFTPLDPVIVPASGWRAGAATLPRTALAVLEELVRAGIGSALSEVEAEIARLSCADPRAVAGIGAALWSPAGAILRGAAGAPAPSGWASAGFPDDAFRPTLLAAGAVLKVATEIDSWALGGPGKPAPTGRDLRDMLAGALSLGVVAGAMLGAVLLARLPALGSEILAAIAAVGPRDGQAADLALGAALGNLHGSLAGEIESAPLSEAAHSIESAATLIQGLSREAGPRRRETLAQDRASLDAKCRARFADVLKHELMEKIEALCDPVAAAEATELENAARDLRRFEQAARLLGGGAAYDAALRRAAEQVRALPGATQQDHADRVRLVEILAGSEQAVRLFALS